MRFKGFVALLGLAWSGLVFSGLVLSALAWPGLARAAQAAEPPVSVVKLISFDCPVCLASESLDEPLRQATRAGGGQFVIAPLPRVSSNARERFYYAVRDLQPDLEARARASLFRGAQELGYPLSDDTETLDWLRQDLGEEAADWIRITTAASAATATDPITRSLRLVVKSGAQLTPTYILIRNGAVLASFDTSLVPGGSLSALRDAVLNGLQTAKTPKKE